MKKIYSKLTKERDVKYQIETAIYKKENGEKIVEKRALTAEAQDHVKNMYKTYQKFQKNDKNPFLLCEQKENYVCFPFINGVSLYEMIIEAAEKKDREKIFEIFEIYTNLISTMYSEKNNFEYSDEFYDMFGKTEHLENQKAAKMVDIDLTFDNIIMVDGIIQIIDYEWTFDFWIPLKFPVYRAVYALWVKHAQLLQEIIAEDEIYKFFDINEEEITLFKTMNDGFMKSVEGKENSYTKMLENYKKPEQIIGKDEMSAEYAEVFWGTEGDYIIGRQETYFASQKRKFRLVISADQYPETDSIRIDPYNGTVLIDVKCLEVETDKTIRKLSQDEYLSNVSLKQENIWLFRGDDPQIIIDISKIKELKKIIFEYEVIEDGMETLVKMVQNNDKKELQKLQSRIQEVEALSEGQARLLNQSAHRLVEYENTIQLLKDKLAYIEGTKVYRTLLKDKVDKIDLWDAIK